MRARRRRAFPWLLALLWTIGAPAGAALAASTSAGRVASAPVIDGVLTEGEWSQATSLSLVHQVEPSEGAPASERTDVYLAYDRETLYLAFDARDRTPAAIRGAVSKRDDLSRDDYVEVWLDTYDDRRRAYLLRVSAAGVQEDGIYTDSTTNDLTWDGVFRSAGRVGPEGYVVEIAIPFRSLRFAGGATPRWGLHLFRWIAHKQERVSWRPISRNVGSQLAQMGELRDLTGVFTGRTLDVIPTLTTSMTDERQPPTTGAANGGLRRQGQIEPGLTASYALTPNLAVSGTANPDFSQVEADVPQITANQRFPLSYPEKRPFFLEGAEVFRSVYSAAPRVVDTRQIVDPDWGGKLTGKVGRTSLGWLMASDRAPGLRAAPGTPGHGENALFTVARASRDVLRQSNIGGFLTDYRFAGSWNTVATIDGRWQVDDRQLIAWQGSYSWTRELDGTRRQGGGSYLAYNYVSRSWDVIVTDSHYARDYRVATGFLRRTGYNRTYLVLGRSVRPSTPSWYVKVRPFVVTLWFRDGRGRTDESFFDPGVDLEFPRGLSVYAYHSRRRDTFLGRTFDTHATVASWSVRRFKRITLEGRQELGTGVHFDPVRPAIGRLLDSVLEATVQPSPALATSVLLLVNRVDDRATGRPLVEQRIARSRTLYQFSRAHAARAIVEYESTAGRLGVSLLYSFTPQPTTAVYAGYGDVLYDELDPLTRQRRPREGWLRQNRTFFLKLSYGLRR